MTTRQEIVSEAMTWIGTPWHHQGRCKGAGVDCGMLLLEVFETVGLISHIDPPSYSQDFMLHGEEERFLATIQEYADEITPVEAQPGDLFVCRHGRTFSHAGIVTAWPQIIHASATDRCVCLADATKGRLARKEQKVFRPRGIK